MIYGGLFDVDSKLIKISSLEKIVNSDGFWNDRNSAEDVIKELNDLKAIVTDIVNLKDNVSDDLDMLNLMKEETDDELLKSLEEDSKNILTKIESLSTFLLLSGPYDKNNCIIEIHAGAGGTEACDWAMMLYRMYTRWIEKKGYKQELLEFLAGDEVGLKSATILVKGTYAYGYLKCEKGVHRLVRLSPFDANNKRHTSFASIDITPEFNQNIDIEIKEEDLKIDVYRSSGAGGQHVNTTDSAVRITHLPSKIVVTCQNERSQIKNRETAMKMLKNKLYLLELENQAKKLNDIKGEHKNIEFGSQIRSYVMHPYSMVKDHRTNAETSNVAKVMDGDIDLFILEYLKGGF